MLALLASLIHPLHLSLALLAVACLLGLLQRRRITLWLVALATAWTLIWSLPATSLYLGSLLEQRYPYFVAANGPKAEAIIVLGGHTANNRANWFLPFDAATARSRVARAAELYLAGRAPRVIVSGGALEGKVSEARNMARLLRQRGVPDAALLLENQSRTTRENAVQTQRMLREHGISSVLLVTSALHMPRSMATFAKQTETTVIAAPVAPQIYTPDNGSLNIWLPDLRTLDASRSIIKEYAGLLVYWLRGWV